MKPAISVIFLTTLIGAAQGLFIAFYSAEILGELSVLATAPQTQSAALAGLISVGLLVAGLVASFFHLGHPERAWRAAAMWRTSWLSREVIALPMTMGLIFVYAILNYFGVDTVATLLDNGYALKWPTLIGLLALLAVILLFICTAMIYSCLKFLRQWHSPLTMVNFILLGTASGFTLAALLATRYDPLLFDYFAGFAVFLTLIGLATRSASLWRNQNLRSPSTLQSAIGVHHPSIRQMAQGAMGGSFNTRAFIHAYGAGVVRLARWYFLLAVFLLPVVLLMLSDETSTALCGLALAVQYSGLLVERWYFFIEAEHPQNVYYQMIS